MTKPTLKQSSASVSISEDSMRTEPEQFSNDPVAKPKTERAVLVVNKKQANNPAVSQLKLGAMA